MTSDTTPPYDASDMVLKVLSGLTDDGLIDHPTGFNDELAAGTKV